MYRSAQPDVEPATAPIHHAFASQDFVGAESSLLKLLRVWTHPEELDADTPVEPLAVVTHALNKLIHSLVHHTPSYAPGRPVRAWQRASPSESVCSALSR